MTRISDYKKIYTIYSFDDIDGAVAAAVCKKHLEQTYIAARATRLRLVWRTVQAKCHKSFNQIKSFIEFDVKPVPRSAHKIQSSSGYLRQHHKEFGISKKLINSFDNFIDIAEIIHGNITLPLRPSACGSITESANDYFLSNAAKLSVLFHTKHPFINKTAMYKKLVNQIAKNPCIEDLFDSDALYSSIIEYESNGMIKRKNEAL